jgi:hypothetical protein
VRPAVEPVDHVLTTLCSDPPMIFGSRKVERSGSVIKGVFLSRDVIKAPFTT